MPTGKITFQFGRYKQWPNRWSLENGIKLVNNLDQTNSHYIYNKHACMYVREYYNNKNLYYYYYNGQTHMYIQCLDQDCYFPCSYISYQQICNTSQNVKFCEVVVIIKNAFSYSFIIVFFSNYF